MHRDRESERERERTNKEIQRDTEEIGTHEDGERYRQENRGKERKRETERGKKQADAATPAADTQRGLHEEVFMIRPSETLL